MLAKFDTASTRCDRSTTVQKLRERFVSDGSTHGSKICFLNIWLNFIRCARYCTIGKPEGECASVLLTRSATCKFTFPMTSQTLLSKIRVKMMVVHFCSPSRSRPEKNAAARKKKKGFVHDVLRFQQLPSRIFSCSCTSSDSTALYL